jgi:hypothetical protein
LRELLEPVTPGEFTTRFLGPLKRAETLPGKAAASVWRKK